MTKIEELKAAYEAAIEEDRVACLTGVACSEALMDFADLAASLMPQLLEAVELLKEVGDVRDMAELMNLWDHKIEPVLEELK